MVPFAHGGFDEPVGFAVDARHVLPRTFGSQPQCLTGLAPRHGAVSNAIVQELPAARDDLAAKPDLFIIGQDLGIEKPCRSVDGDVGFFVARTAGPAKPPISLDPVADAVKQNQLFYVDMKHVAGLGSQVSAYRHRRLQIFETSQTHGGSGARRPHPPQAEEGTPG